MNETRQSSRSCKHASGSWSSSVPSLRTWTLSGWCGARPCPRISWQFYWKRRRWSIWNRFWDPGLSFSTNSPAVSKQSTIWMGTSPTCSGCFGSILRTANDFRTAPIITGEATLPLRWLRQLPLCGLAGRNYLALQVAPVRQVF